MSSTVKGILKGFKYFTQIFEGEKEQDIQIGFPTDVKHVAHIGWDNPSLNSPSWISDFNSSPGADVQNKGQEKESRRRSNRDSPDLPKASKRHSTAATDSPTREKGHKPRTRKYPNKYKDDSNPTRLPVSPDSYQLPPSLPAPDNNIPKKSRRHKTKESSASGSAKLRPKAQPASDSGSQAQTMSRNSPMTPFDEPEQDLLL